MRESMGGAWIFQLVIGFILLFVAFLTVSINYTKSFRVKNEVLDMIERNEGFTKDAGGSIDLINNYLSLSGYKSTGKCPNGYKGVRNLKSLAVEDAQTNVNYYYCVKKTSLTDSAYYDVRLFFDFNLPIFGSITTYSVNGSTTQIPIPADASVFGP